MARPTASVSGASASLSGKADAMAAQRATAISTSSGSMPLSLSSPTPRVDVSAAASGLRGHGAGSSAAPSFPATALDSGAMAARARRAPPRTAPSRSPKSLAATLASREDASRAPRSLSGSTQASRQAAPKASTKATASPRRTSTPGASATMPWLGVASRSALRRARRQSRRAGTQRRSLGRICSRSRCILSFRSSLSTCVHVRSADPTLPHASRYASARGFRLGGAPSSTGASSSPPSTPSPLGPRLGHSMPKRMSCAARRSRRFPRMSPGSGLRRNSRSTACASLGPTAAVGWLPLCSSCQASLVCGSRSASYSTARSSAET
mmetsp:Transcript_9222/g.26991  ORF Transcript_9222/g.26991 Transcript_9222/m.26991 type:complete len:324 (-) Transcript_9222:104-1075(-)